MNTTLFTKTLKMLVSFILVLGLFVSYSPSFEAATTKATTYRLSTDTYLYDKTTSSRKRLLTIKTGTIVSSTYESASFRRVSYNGKTGYVASKYLTAYDKKETIKGQRFLVSKKTPLHTAASTTAPVITTLNEQDAYYSSQKITNSVGEVWYRVKYDEKIGYARFLNAQPISYTRLAKTTLKTTDGYILRQYAGTAYPRQLVVPTGTSLQTTGRIGDWYNVTYAGKSGYMHKAAFISSSKQTTTGINIPETTFKASATTMYDSVLSTKKSVIKIPNNTILKSTLKIGNYHRVTYNKKVGYVPTSSLTLYTSKSKITLTRILLSKTVDIKNNPSSTGKNITTLKKDSVYYTTELYEDPFGVKWHKIKKDNLTGYVQVNQGDSVPYTVQNYSVKIISKATLRSYAGHDYAALKSIPVNTSVKVTGQIGSWYRMTYDGMTGYVMSDVTEPFIVKKSITGSRFFLTAPLEIKAQPNERAVTVATLKKDDIYYTTQLITNEKSERWHRVTKDGQTGYVRIGSANEISYQSLPLTRYITRDTTSLRSYAGSSYGALATFEKGTVLSISGKIGNWVRISNNGKIGYVDSSSVTEYQETKKISGVRFILAEKTSIKSQPNTTSSVIASLNAGNVYYTTSLITTSSNEQWHKVTIDGKTGYIPLKNNLTSIPYLAKDSLFVRSSTNAYLRSYVGDGYAVLKTIPANTVLTVTGQIGLWYKTSYEGQSGYVYNTSFVTTSSKLNVYNSIPTPYTFDSFIATQMRLNPSPQTDLYQNKPMYVSDSYLRFGGSIDPVNGSLATVISSTPLNIRSGATTSSHIYGQFKPNTLIKVYQNINGFYMTYPRVHYSNTSYSTIGWLNALESDVRNASDPSLVNRSSKEFYQFLDLSKTTGATPETLNKIISTKGIFGKCTTGSCGQAFIDAGTKYSVNEVYLISHALLETGNGTSKLANGVIWNGRMVYNMYGIGAIDSDPINGGARTAYEKGWFTPEAAIMGGAEFIGTQYIHHAYNQNTLYKMRWNPMSPGRHQYATDMGWASKQTTRIYDLYQQMDSYTAIFDIPVFVR
ncbi:SH3 domain-containing protein [Exiguobacterium undae]